jgi:hypothetical protein
MKNSIYTIGNQPPTFRFVAQCLNHPPHRVPSTNPQDYYGITTRISNFEGFMVLNL